MVILSPVCSDLKNNPKKNQQLVFPAWLYISTLPEAAWGYVGHAQPTAGENTAGRMSTSRMIETTSKAPSINYLAQSQWVKSHGNIFL